MNRFSIILNIMITEFFYFNPIPKVTLWKLDHMIADRTDIIIRGNPASIIRIPVESCS